MKNPKYSKMLKAFINHIDRRENKSGWQIVDKPFYESTKFNKTNRSERPLNSKRQIFKVYAEWKEMGEKDLDWEIETFLKDYEE